MKNGLLALLILTLCGCGNTTSVESTVVDAATDAAAEALPSFPDAVAKIREYCASIAGAFEAGNPEECHDALHQVGHLLPQLGKIAEAAGLDAAGVQEAADSLMGSFGKIDKSMHGEDGGATYGEVEADVTSALDKLSSFLP